MGIVLKNSQWPNHLNVLYSYRRGKTQVSSMLFFRKSAFVTEKNIMNLVSFKESFLWHYEEQTFVDLTLTGGRATVPGTIVTPDDGQSDNFIVRVTGILDHWAVTGPITCQGGPPSPKHGSREGRARRGYGGHSKTVNCKLAGTLFRKMLNTNKHLKSK